MRYECYWVDKYFQYFQAVFLPTTYKKRILIGWKKRSYMFLHKDRASSYFLIVDVLSHKSKFRITPSIIQRDIPLFNGNFSVKRCEQFSCYGNSHLPIKCLLFNLTLSHPSHFRVGCHTSCIKKSANQIKDIDFSISFSWVVYCWEKKKSNKPFYCSLLIVRFYLLVIQMCS